MKANCCPLLTRLFLSEPWLVFCCLDLSYLLPLLPKSFRSSLHPESLSRQAPTHLHTESNTDWTKEHTAQLREESCNTPWQVKHSPKFFSDFYSSKTSRSSLKVSEKRGE